MLRQRRSLALGLSVQYFYRACGYSDGVRHANEYAPHAADGELEKVVVRWCCGI